MNEHALRPAGTPRGLKAALLAALVFLVTLNLRPAITTVGPVLSDIGETYQMGEGLLGLLGSLPLFMFAAVSIVSSSLAGKVGLERALWFALIAIATGIIIRSLLGLPGLWVGTALATASIAVGNVLVPVVVRNDYPNHMALATGIYSATMGFAAGSASALSAPGAERFGWQTSLLLWSIPAVVVAILWLPRVLHSTAAAVPERGSAGPSVWSSASAWWLTIYMGVQSAAFYFMITWLPTYLVAEGTTSEEAGMTLFWYQIAGITAGVFTPLLFRGRQTQTLATVVATLPIIVGMLGLIVDPQRHVLWSVVLGVGSGLSLVVSLSLISLRGTGAQHTARLSGMVQSAGYLIAALAPLIAGTIAQVTGSLRTAFMMMVGVALVQLTVAVFAGRSRA